ncbi:MAG: hypothetical protein ABFR82_15500 [Nitrospirota bacterium]
MKRNIFIFIAILAVSLITISIPSQSMALTDAQEEKYREARILLKEGKTSEAKNIFTALSLEESSDPRIRLGLIDTTIGEAVILRAGNQSTWKYKIQEAFIQLKGMHRANIAFPDMYLSFAKCYAMNDRLRKSKKSLAKAFYYKPDYIEAFIVQGDIYSDRSKEETETSNAKNTAKDSYKAAIAMSDTDQYTQAMLSYKLGDLDLYHGKKETGIKNLNKAIELSSDSYWADKSRQRIMEASR